MTSKKEIEIPAEVAEKIGSYVYVLVDPRVNSGVFYVGKGKGSRISSHIREADENPNSHRAKLARIQAIEKAGKEVQLLFVRTNITADEALIAEQACIDAYRAGGHDLTNIVKGHKSGIHGLASLQTVVGRFSGKPLPSIKEPTMIFKINKKWKPEMLDPAVYEQTRGNWYKVGKDSREQAQIALGVANGVVRGVYEIQSWAQLKAGTDKGRWIFSGIPSARYAKLIGNHIRDLNKRGDASAYRVFLDGYPGSAK